MKTIMKRAIRQEEGNVLIIVLVLLVVGGLILAPLLGLMTTGLVAGQVYEKKMDEYYAADAGVEDAIWKIKYDPPDSYPYEYPDPVTVNGKTVDIIIYQEDIDPTCEEELRYQILSTAASDDGSSTTIDAYLSASYMDFSALLDYAIVSDATITIKPGTEVDGDVWLPDESGLDDPKNGILGEVDTSYDISMTWPEADDLSDYYWEDVKHLEAEAYPDGYVINIPGGTTEEDPYTIGPLLAAGDLTIKGDGWIRLDGTIYVKGSLLINPTPEIHLDLSGHTIFVENEIDMNPGSPDNTITLHGSGCIIAIHDINFRPNQDSDGNDFVLVMSLEGTVQFNPGTDFTGCIAGNVHVQLQPGITADWISPEGQGLDFPMGVGDINELPPVTGVSILSWQIGQGG